MAATEHGLTDRMAYPVPCTLRSREGDRNPGVRNNIPAHRAKFSFKSKRTDDLQWEDLLSHLQIATTVMIYSLHIVIIAVIVISRLQMLAHIRAYIY
jgi:hypothetical protein